MASVEIRRTTALYPDAVFVQWDINADEPGAHLVDVARAEGPSGPWETIVVGMRDAYNFVDNKFSWNFPPAPPGSNGREGTNLFSLARAIYYQITVTPPSGPSNRFSSDPTPVEPGLDTRTRLLKRKILRDQAVGYRRLNGVPLIVLKRRRWGERCSKCWDAATNQATLEHCLACFGTSYEGGYWTPTLIRGRREAAAVETQMTSDGDSDMKLANFNVLDYPLIEYKDIIVDLVRNDRYQVQRAHGTELKSVTVHQKVTASLLGRNSIEYKVLVDPEAIPPLY
jgi:hypothetical protein